MLRFSNGKSYIGQTRGRLSQRIGCHRRNARAGEPYALYAAWRKYGEPQSIKLGTYPLDDLNAMETKLIKEFGTLTPRGYNIESGGGVRKHMPASTREKLSKSLTGRVLSTTHVKNMSAALTGVEKTLEHRANMVKAWERRRERGSK